MLKPNRIVFLKALFYASDFFYVFDKVTYKTKVVYSEKTIKNTNADQGLYLIQDVPNYLKTHTPEKSKFKKTEVQTLQGFLVETNKFDTLEAYLKHNFGAKSRSNLRRYQNRLEKCFTIDYTCYYGSIPKEEYNKLFIALKELLIRRFEEKKESNYELQHFDEYHDLIYNLILKKEASLFVIYHNKKPISIRINMFKANLGFYIMSCYDIDYSKFHLGAIDMLKNIEWCFKNDIATYDLLKGYEYYKKDWMTTTYSYYNHIIYDANSSKATLVAFFTKLRISYRYKLYYILKRINLHHPYKKIKQFLYNLSNKNKNHKELKQLTVSDLNLNKKENRIDFENNTNYHFIKKYVIDLLFISKEHYNDIKVYRILAEENYIVIEGKNKEWFFKILN
ncbi:GNAT family N-acetyltransferase [Cellulophaga sp. F20128]|uniref:GNAT family N-acetyltransferase n=1 Tax=Cellulophaga sp. F20128 TaxID=2926413 RepID=UPI001FF4D88D|nr:GNAT family N-acetyltransferase [Cellulophaga sp. F20128]MCK0156868.1 GNAT family N-acetyltransferase [Cellulophaga sp. F20128]